MGDKADFKVKIFIQYREKCLYLLIAPTTPQHQAGEIFHIQYIVYTISETRIDLSLNMSIKLPQN